MKAIVLTAFYAVLPLASALADPAVSHGPLSTLVPCAVKPGVQSSLTRQHLLQVSKELGSTKKHGVLSTIASIGFGFAVAHTVEHFLALEEPCQPPRIRVDKEGNLLSIEPELARIIKKLPAEAEKLR
jgi:hypothetical protein